jgi:hypothetical protein
MKEKSEMQMESLKCLVAPSCPPLFPTILPSSRKFLCCVLLHLVVLSTELILSVNTHKQVLLLGREIESTESGAELGLGFVVTVVTLEGHRLLILPAGAVLPEASYGAG